MSQSPSNLIPKISVGENCSIDTRESGAFLTSDMTFRAAVKIALSVYSTQGFLDFKKQFDQIRNKYATGLGSLEQIAILDKKNEPTLEGVFKLMNTEQSERFQKEFFEGMIPHWVSQQDIWKNLHDGKRGEYEFKIQGPWLNKILFKFMAKVLSEQQFVEAVVMTQKSTWIDDGEKTVHLRAKMG